ncbi:P-loop ATPase, Sll1717 family [Micromonospora sp. NPDC005087]|uniref:P-loop ATPase, Sll1717 family n=1 Tax=Micromonospora sp. NPDC005087 TaxID=3364225 RepID=UPI00367E05F8
MAARQPKRRIRNEFTLGEGAAEYDGLLRDAFYETWLYRSVVSRDDQRCFLIGRTGSGKSALFRQIEYKHGDHLIRLSPEDLSLTYISELQAVRFLKSLDVHLDPLFIALWKHVLIIEIIKHRYQVDSPEAKQRFLSGLMDKIRRDKSKQEALKYLEDFEGKFWQETDERVREIIEKFETQVKAEAGGKISAGIGSLSVNGADALVESLENRSELVNRFQRLVNETQLPRLNKMERVLNEDILDSAQHYTYIVIDDLDRDWADEKVTNDLIRCLFRAVMDLKRVENLKVLVALRTNIFEALDFGRTGGQEEKFRGLSHTLKWSKSELRDLLDSRVSVAAQRHGLDNVESMDELLPRSNPTRGNPLDYILNRTLLRPRDAIAFLNECFTLSNGKEKLTWPAIQSAESAYSKNRLLALRDEWKPTYPGIERVLAAFTRAPNTLDWEEMAKRLVECALLTAEPDFAGTVWLTGFAEPLWSASSSDDPAEVYQALIRLLHNIGFIGCITTVDEVVGSERRRVDEPAIYNNAQPSFPDHVSNLRKVAAFVVHPAFRPALDIRD